MALGVALGADIAGPRQVRQHLRQGHRQLPFKPACLLRPLLSFARPFQFALLRLRRLRLRLLPRLDRRLISRDMPHQMTIIHGPSNQLLVQTARKTASGILGKGLRKRSLARKSAGAAPAAKPPEPSVKLGALDRHPRRRNIEHGLGDEGTYQRRADLLRPPCLTAKVGRKTLDPQQLQNRDEELFALARRAELALEPREQLQLKGVTIFPWQFGQGHRATPPWALCGVSRQPIILVRMDWPHRNVLNSGKKAARLSYFARESNVSKSLPEILRRPFSRYRMRSQSRSISTSFIRALIRTFPPETAPVWTAFWQDPLIADRPSR